MLPVIPKISFRNTIRVSNSLDADQVGEELYKLHASILILILLFHIRIYRVGRIEKSVLRIAVWHHKACGVMTNSDLEVRIFLSYSHMNNGFFFLLITVFIYLYICLFVCLFVCLF